MDSRPVLALEVSVVNRRWLHRMLRDSYVLRQLTPGAEETILPPDACLLDEDSLQRCAQLRELWACVPLLVLSSIPDEKTTVAVLDAGADDVLRLPIGEEEVRARVRAHLRRARMTQGNEPERLVSADGRITLEKAGRVLKMAGIYDASLTVLEFGLLWQLMRREGAILSSSSLLEQVWGPAYGDEIGSLRVYIYQLRQLIKMAGPGPYIHTESHYGYRFQSPAR